MEKTVYEYAHQLPNYEKNSSVSGETCGICRYGSNANTKLPQNCDRLLYSIVPRKGRCDLFGRKDV
jgi:hypothetical protein